MNNSRYISVLLVLLVAAASTTKFDFYIGFRIQYFEVIGIILLSLLISSRPNISRLYQSEKHFLIIQAAALFFAMFVPLSIATVSQNERALSMIGKGIAVLSLRVVLIAGTTFILFRAHQVIFRSLRRTFIITTLLSAIYGVAAILLLLTISFDLDRFVSERIPLSSGIWPTEYSRWGSTVRLTGFANDPSVFAAFAIPAILISFDKIAHEEKRALYCLITGAIITASILTISVSGTAGLLSAIAIYTLIYLTRQVRITETRTSFVTGALFFLILVATPPLLLYINFPDETRHLLAVKLNPDGTALTHALIGQNALSLAKSDYFMGAGYNTFSLLYERFFGLSNYNAHNSWLTFLVEIGAMGTLLQLLYYAFLVTESFKMEIRYQARLLALIFAVNISALGYELLNSAYLQLAIVAFWVEGRRQGDTKPLRQKESSWYQDSRGDSVR